MKALLVALLLFAGAAQAASPEDNYIAARDRFIRQLTPKNNAPITDAMSKADERALADLEGQIKAIIGSVAVEGVAREGKFNLETLIPEMGFGHLDALVFASPDETTRLYVTTPSLLRRWIAGHAKQIGKEASTDVAAALRRETFYTQAFSTDAAVSHFADIPVVKPARASVANAMLTVRRQDIGLTIPTEIIVSVVREDRAFIWTAPATGTIAMMGECEAVWQAAEKKREQAYAAYQTSQLKDKKRFDESVRIEEEGDVAYRKCFAERAKDAAFFPGLVKQAQELVDRLK